MTWDPIMAEKAGYKHFMLKEIYEQPRAVRDTTLGRISRHRQSLPRRDEHHRSRIQASRTRSTSPPAAPVGTPALAGKFMIERLARLPVDVDYASDSAIATRSSTPNTLTL